GLDLPKPKVGSNAGSPLPPPLQPPPPPAAPHADKRPPRPPVPPERPRAAGTRGPPPSWWHRPGAAPLGPGTHAAGHLPPRGVVAVPGADEGVGDLMEHGLQDGLGAVHRGEVLRQRDPLAVVVALAETPPRVI